MKLKVLVVAGLIVSACSIVSLNSSASATSSPGGLCRPFTQAVSLSPGKPANQQVRGTFCTPAKWASDKPHTVDVLSSGATYSRLYWDWAQDPTLYSYAAKTVQAGRATLVFDRLGTGASSHPTGTKLSMTSDAFVLHQIIARARQQGMAKVNSIGHSLGSMIAIKEAATFHDVDHLVLTGILHFQSDEGPVGFPGFYPAEQDPVFAGLGLDSSYLTTVPGVRGQLFYNQQFADPAVIAFDETHKDLVTTTEFETGIQEAGTPAPLNISANVTAPVLVVIGQQDTFFCGGAVDCSDAAQVAAHEASYFPRAASLTAVTVANTGHDLTLHPTAPQSFASINDWLKR